MVYRVFGKSDENQADKLPEGLGVAFRVYRA